MPRYVYRCTTCDNEFELTQGYDAAPVTDCTECRQPAKRVPAGGNIIFKGTGFSKRNVGPPLRRMPREDAFDYPSVEH